MYTRIWLIPSDPCSSQKMPILDNRVCVSIRDNAKLQHVTFTCIILHHFFRGMQFTHLLSICRRLCAAVWREDSSAKASWLVKTCNFTFTRWCYCIVQKQSISSFIQCCVCVLCVLWQVRTYKLLSGSYPRLQEGWFHVRLVLHLSRSP